VSESEQLSLALLVEHARGPVSRACAARNDVEARLTLLALFNRAVVTAEAITVLARAGHGRDAVTLSRTLCEVAIDVLWAGQHRELVEDRALGFARYRQHLVREAARANPEALGPVPDDRLNDEELKRHRSTYGPHGAHGWTGKTVEQRAKAVKRSSPQLVERVDNLLLFMRLADLEVHPDIWSMARSMRWLADGDRRRLQIRAEPEHEASPLALRSACWSLLVILEVVHDDIELPPEDLYDAWNCGAGQLED